MTMTCICQIPLAPHLNFLSVSNSAAEFTLHLPLFILQPKNILFITIATRFSPFSFSSSSHYSWYRKMNYRWLLLLLLLFKSMQSSLENWNESSEEVMIQDGYLQWVNKMGSLKHSVFKAAKNKVTPTKTITVSKTNTISCFVSVQEAIDSLPFISLQRVIINIHEGVYREKVEIPPTKAYITLVGAGADETIIEWGDSADHIGKDGKPLGTFGSATVAVNSPYFVAKNITFKNTAPLPPSGASGKQGVALRISGDTAAFVGCKFYGGQDTLYDHEGRHYFRDCYIEGSVDFIFGNGLSLYEGCHLHAISDAYGALTAQSRGSILEETGFSFLRCKVTGSGALYLGRAWGTFSRVVFAYTFMDKIIMPRGWYNWGDPKRQMTVFYGQYRCYGPGANFSGRVSWSKELTPQEARPFLSLTFIDGSEWLHY